MKKSLGIATAVVLLGLVGAFTTGCSSSNSNKVQGRASSAVSAAQSALSSALGNLTSAAASKASSALAPSSAQSSAAPSSAATSLDLSGTWSGQYSGSYQGTFTLMWQQSGNSLVGTVQLSSPAVSVPLTGTLNGSTITFGTVGSVAITYTGTAAAQSMSGSYSVAGSNAGSWSATKQS